MNKRRKKILFLYSHTGSGHIVSARAIEEQINLIEPNGYDFKYFDFVGETSRAWSIFEVGYTPMIKYAPFTWGFAYKVLSPDFNLMLLEKSAGMFMSKKIAKIIHEYGPDIIVSVHPLANHLTTAILRKSKKETPFIVVVTDPVTFHKSWLGCNKFLNIEDKTTAAIVATNEGYELGKTYGFPEEKLHIMGLPIRNSFYKDKPLEKNNEKFTVMFMGGGDGAGKITSIIRALGRKGFTGKIIVMCGKNNSLKKKLEKQASNFPSMEMEIHGFTEKVKELMDRSDILVTKAGPGTIAEAVSRELPVIVYYWVPGQEVGNARYVHDKKIGFVLKKTEAIVRQIALLQSDRTMLEGLRKNIKKVQTPNATNDIAKKIMSYT